MQRPVAFVLREAPSDHYDIRAICHHDSYTLRRTSRNDTGCGMVATPGNRVGLLRCLGGTDRGGLTGVDDHVDQIHALGERVPEVDVMERHDAALTLGSLQRLAPLQRLLASHLVFIELGKIVDDNRNGQRNDQHATDTTDATDDLAERRGRVDVAVADCGHGDAGPPERFRYGQELGVGFLLLGEVRQTREYQHAHGQEQHEQAQLLVRVAQREPEAL